MELVELSGIKDTIVGLPGVNGLSTEQIKWLTIPVELVASPSIIFMDEPTSGLASRAAEIVMRTVRNTVNTGRIVVCTIHQPSIDIFEALMRYCICIVLTHSSLLYAGFLWFIFGFLIMELVLMKRGDQIIYTLGHWVGTRIKLLSTLRFVIWYSSYFQYHIVLVPFFILWHCHLAAITIRIHLFLL
jgi:hypothetical protein